MNRELKHKGAYETSGSTTIKHTGIQQLLLLLLLLLKSLLLSHKLQLICAVKKIKKAWIQPTVYKFSERSCPFTKLKNKSWGTSYLHFLNIYLQNIYITYHIYRYKQYIINIKIVKILITITTTAMVLVTNYNNINNINNYNCNNNKNKQTNKNKTKNRKGKKRGKKNQKNSEDFHIYSHAKKLHESLANFNIYFLDIHHS